MFINLRARQYARVILLTGCVQKVISPQINDSTINILNRHGVEVHVSPRSELLWFIKSSFGKRKISASIFYTKH